MTTGLAWDISNPLKPVALFDPDAERVIPYEADVLLASMGTTYGSHDVDAPAPLECKSKGAYADGVIPIRMAVASGASFSLNKKYPFTIKLVGADGQKDERTLWLKFVEQ